MFKQVWNKLFQTASPCEPFVAGALRFIISHVDAQFAERLHQLLRAHLFVRAAAEEEIMHFLVELTCIGKHTVEARFHVQPENRPAEPANVGEQMMAEIENVKTGHPPHDKPAIARCSRSVLVRNVQSIIGMRSFKMTS